MVRERSFVFVQGMPVNPNGRIITSEKKWAEPTTDPVLREYWAGVAEAALPRFSELQARERVGYRELGSKLGAIRRAGYEVPPYSQLNTRSRWNLLIQIRAEVYSQARAHCPDVLDGIIERNQMQRSMALQS